MYIDPVVALAAELSRTEDALAKARDKGDDRLVYRLTAKVALLNEDFYGTAPTSALGAAELLRRAALSLRATWPAHAYHMREIADRMADGRRDIADIVWLRAMYPAMDAGSFGREGTAAAGLVALAIKGACRPLVVFRAAMPPRTQKGAASAKSIHRV